MYMKLLFRYFFAKNNFLATIFLIILIGYFISSLYLDVLMLCYTIEGLNSYINLSSYYPYGIAYDNMLSD